LVPSVQSFVDNEDGYSDCIPLHASFVNCFKSSLVRNVKWRNAITRTLYKDSLDSNQINRECRFNVTFVAKYIFYQQENFIEYWDIHYFAKYTIQEITLIHLNVKFSREQNLTQMFREMKLVWLLHSDSKDKAGDVREFGELND
jgi:hypothetical protein